jgi:predicted RNA-binding protein with PUA-like domain
MGDDVCICTQCLQSINDAKVGIKCNKCLNHYHSNCQDVNLRGFHLRKATWICKKCSDAEEVCASEIPQKNQLKETNTNREENGMENIMKMLVTVNKSNIKMQQTLDEVVNENKKLRFEIAQLKEEKLQKIESKTKTFATAVLQIKPKNKGEEVKKMKDQIRNRINPAELGVGLLIGKTTKNGDLILTCKNEEKDMREIQHKIQEDMGQNYEVSEKRLHKNRIKIVGIHEQENSETDKTLIEKIINQNELDRQRSEVEIIYRSKISNKRFSIILESNELVYKRLIAGEVYIGWSRCKAYEEFGVFRCYKCNKYGHKANDCKGEVTCPICSEKHVLKECKNNTKKCVNSTNANEKLKLKLSTDHEVWDRNCASFIRILETQKRKFANISNT